MKKKNLAKAITLGLLLAMPCQVLAADLIIDTTTDVNTPEFASMTYRGNESYIYYFNNTTADTITISGDVTSNFNVQFAGEAVNAESDTNTVHNVNGNIINITEGAKFNKVLNGAYLQNATGIVENNLINITKADISEMVVGGNAYNFVGDSQNNSVRNNKIVVELNDDNKISANIIGGFINYGNGDIHDNTVKITGGSLYSVYGGSLQYANGNVINNKVELINIKDFPNSSKNTVYGGQIYDGTGNIMFNSVKITEGIVDNVRAAAHQGKSGKVIGNTVELINVTGSDDSDIVGAFLSYNGDFEEVSENTVTLKGNTVVDSVHAVALTTSSNPTVKLAYNNTITLADSANVTNELNGFKENNGNVESAYNNTLIIDENWTGKGNGTATVTENTLNNVQNFDTVEVGWTDGEKQLTINNFTENALSKEATTFVVNDIGTKVNVNNYNEAAEDVAKAAPVIEATSRVTDQLDVNDVEGSLRKIANNFNAKTGQNEDVEITQVSSAAGTLLGASSVEVTKDETTGEYVAVEGSFNQEENASNAGVSEMTSLGLISWRAETNDMNKRMGELRNANGEHGVWVRMVRGEAEYKSIKNQYNQYQLGYDEKLSVDKRWTVGAAISYTDAENNFKNGSGESENKALAIYGSKLNKDGSFVDLIAKYGRLENDFKMYGDEGIGDADYSTNAYSLSAEFGKRLQQGKGLWIEPQVELTYGKVSNVTYTSAKGAVVAQDGVESLIGRVGFSLGKDIKQGNVYARASYLYDFDGEANATMRYGTQVVPVKEDLGGGWWEVGVGANINLSKATYIYADVEKTFGGEVDTNWQWNLGVRYSF